ncbi:MAG: LysR family transcriptional regulator [Clostridia bacterium]|nr:LysR family transcriptional regulator [Clostridia bacterium]
MELLQLKYFCHAAESENFSKTARIFMVPPSDISQSIKRLEKELGVSLFDRRANSITLSETGKRFYLHAKAALEELKLATDTLRQEETQLKICIKVNRRITMQAVEKFRHAYPEVDLIVRHHADREDERFDLIIDSDDHTAENYLAAELFSEEIVLALREDDPLAAKEPLCAADLQERPFITMNSGDSIHTVTRNVCGAMGFSPRIAIQSDDPFYIRQCVELGLGVSVIPSLSWRGQFSQKVLFKKLLGSMRKTYVFYQKHPHPIAMEFIELIRQEFKKEQSST